MDQFSRSRALLGQDALKKLQASAVAVFGIGGVGSHSAEALARSGVGKIDLFDGDKVCLSNINRQIIAAHSVIGQNKVDVMKARILDINPACEVQAHFCFYSEENADDYDLSRYDYIIDAIDTVASKLTLIERANKAGVPVISSMGTGNKLDPTRFEVTDIYKTSVCPLAKVMRSKLRKAGITELKVVYSREEPVLTPAGEYEASGSPQENGKPEAPDSTRRAPGSVAFVPPAAGLILAGEVIKDLIK